MRESKICAPSAPLLLQEPQSERRSCTKLRPGQISKTLAAATRAVPNTVAGLSFSVGEESDDDGECEEITQEGHAFYVHAAHSGYEDAMKE
jgi:hypothetical protein